MALKIALCSLAIVEKYFDSFLHHLRSKYQLFGTHSKQDVKTNSVSWPNPKVI